MPATSESNLLVVNGDSLSGKRGHGPGVYWGREHMERGSEDPLQALSAGKNLPGLWGRPGVEVCPTRALAYQRNFAAIWMARAPLVLAPLVMLPKLPLVKLLVGFPRLKWLNALNASARNWKL